MAPRDNSPALQSVLRQIAVFARRRYRALFLSAAVLGTLALAAALRLDFDTEILNLLPADDPAVRTFRSTVQEFGSLDVLLVVVRLPQDGEQHSYLDFVDILGSHLEKLADLESADYRPADLGELVEEILPHAFLLLTGEERRRVLELFSQQGIEERVELLRRRAVLPLSADLRRLLQLDPMGLSEVLLERLSRSHGALKFGWTQSHFLSADGRLALLVAKPARPAMEAEFGRHMLASVRAAIEAATREWSASTGGLPPPRVELGGPYVTMSEDAGNMARDVAANILSAMLGVLLLFAVAFRRLSLVGYALLPLGFGLLLAFGFAALTFGTLSPVTSGFAALLLGLGIDFVIVSYGRYVEERGRGGDLETALAAMGGSSGRAVITGAVTTAATFFAFAVTDFVGLRQMGLLTGSGILLCMLSVLFLLPSLLAWSDDRRRRRADPRRLYLIGFGAEHLLAWSLRRPRTVIALAVALTAVASVLAPRVRFEDDIRKLRPDGSRGVAVQNEVAAGFGSSFNFMMLVLNGDSEDEIIRLARRAEERAKELIDAGQLAAVESIASFFPDTEQQRANLEWLAANSELLDAQRIRRTFSAAAATAGLNAQAFDPGLDLLTQATAVRRPITTAELPAGSRASRIVRRYLRHGSGVKAVVYLHPPGGSWRRSTPSEVEDLARSLGPQVALSGSNLIGERLRKTVRIDAWKASVLGLAVVTFLLWLDYRRLLAALLSLLPLGVGIIWMFGGMAGLGLDMNFFNIFVATMIIGIGVDYGVHILHRYHETDRSSRAELQRSLGETAKAIAVAALSTCVGFGSLSLSHYPGLRSMGWVAILGAASTALVAITLLPALLALATSSESDPR